VELGTPTVSTHKTVTAVTSTDSAAFFLPGLIHQFGNLLLTVQGNALHVQPDEIPAMQEAVLGSVKRGSASLQAMRLLLGEVSQAPESAQGLLENLVELGRVPCRERGLTLDLAELPTAGFWLPVSPFLPLCAEALHRLVMALPVGSEGALRLVGSFTPERRFLVRLSFEAAPGSLPFAISTDTALESIVSRADEYHGNVQASRSADTISLSFEAAAGGASIG